ncbi:hypothetical protein V6N13_098807 [Hibiscus sabdariffa]
MLLPPMLSRTSTCSTAWAGWCSSGGTCLPSLMARTSASVWLGELVYWQPPIHVREVMRLDLAGSSTAAAVSAVVVLHHAVGIG